MIVVSARAAVILTQEVLSTQSHNLHPDISGTVLVLSDGTSIAMTELLANITFDALITSIYGQRQKDQMAYSIFMCFLAHCEVYSKVLWIIDYHIVRKAIGGNLK